MTCVPTNTSKVVTELFNVQFFIISQTNPHIIPLLHIRKLVASLPAGRTLHWIGRQIENEFKMRCGQVKMVMGSGLLFWGASLFFQVGSSPPLYSLSWTTQHRPSGLGVGGAGEHPTRR